VELSPHHRSTAGSQVEWTRARRSRILPIVMAAGFGMLLSATTGSAASQEF
jgi:hypothetical protein